jgi:iron complex transport system substrate-binding protein
MKIIKKKWLFRLLSIILVTVLLSSCSGVPANQKAEDEETFIFTDSVGREVELPKNITRIVPSGSFAQIILFAVAPDSLIGVSGAWSDDAEKYLDKKYLDLPQVGQFFGQRDLNLEEITKLDPQVIIDVGETKDSIAEDLDGITEQTGIPAIHIAATTQTMGEAFRTLGKLLGEEEQGNALGEYCDSKYQNTLNIMAQVEAEGAKKSVLYCTSENGQSVVAVGSYHAEIIDLLADNKAVVDNPSSKGSGNEADMEQIIDWDPDVIIFAPDSIYDNIKDEDTWMELKAVRNNDYYEVPFGPYNWMGFPPSCNRYIGMLWMTQLLYPEIALYDMEAETKNYYQLFYHCQLSTKQYEKLVKNSILKK